MPLPLFLDCDPGIDDAIALGYLLCQDDVEIVGIAASGGNVPTAQVAENTLAWLGLAGRPDLPVHRGVELPLRHRDRAPGAPAPEVEYADLTTVPPGSATPGCRRRADPMRRPRPLRPGWMPLAPVRASSSAW